VREYLVDIDRRHLQSRLPDSLIFTAELVYDKIVLPVRSAVPVRPTPDLDIRFEPDYHFVPPVARLDVDRVVSSMNWKAIITKPYEFAGQVTLNLETPHGVYAGAYRTQWDLEAGRTSQTVRIPFSVSNLFELGVQKQTITLLAGGQSVATDTGRIRIAACNIDETVNIGFLPDSSGKLEDILRLTQARHRPITDRTLVTGDLDAYQVIVFGPGAFREYPSLFDVKHRLEDYLRFGGSIVVLGQPGDWPEGILPVSLVPTSETIGIGQLSIRLPRARILSRPHQIDQPALLAYFERPRTSSPAIVAPAERVLVTDDGASLLSVSRLGDGQVIYCGLPLLEMVADLDLEAIHLLANILSY
jgi:hypothetical protein